MTDLQIQIDLPMEKIEEFCRRWNIVELALFGSVLRDDFRPDSDVDVLVTFADNNHWSLFHIVDMREELIGILGHEVDFVERGAVEKSRNYIRRKAILDSAKTIYVA